MNDHACRLLITGHVQGVGYRAWFKRRADALGLHGWVHNRHDGSVEALIRGSGPSLAAMIEAAHRGPSGSRVHALSRLHAIGMVPERFDIKPDVPGN